MRIPITMCHGISWQPRSKKLQGTYSILDKARFENYFQIAVEMGFQSISYDDLAKWRAGKADLPKRPIMFDFDHPDYTIAWSTWVGTSAHTPTTITVSTILRSKTLQVGCSGNSLKSATS